MSGAQSINVKWDCWKCRLTGTVPQFHNTTIQEIEENIDRGHQRRAKDDCHKTNGIREVRAVVNGIRVRFGGIQSQRPENVAPQSRETDDQSSGNTAGPG